MGKNTRDSNIELLRIILMFMIIMHHLIVHGYQLYFPVNNPFQLQHQIVLMFLNSFFILAVNTYVLISAYFGIRFSLKSLISFIVQASFYSVLIYIVACFCGWDVWSLPDFYRSIIPILSGKWWFLSAYILLLILSPIMNAGLDNITKNQHLFILIGTIVIAASFLITNFDFRSAQTNKSSLGLFLTIYICGRYLRKYPVQIKKPFLGYIACSLILFVYCFIYYEFISVPSAWLVFSYVNPIIILAAVCLFYTFKQSQINSDFINKVSVLTFGIYLIHDSDPVRRLLVHQMQKLEIENTFILLLVLFILAILIFTICACIEKIRQMIFTPIVDRIADSQFVKKINI